MSTPMDILRLYVRKNVGTLLDLEPLSGLDIRKASCRIG